MDIRHFDLNLLLVLHALLTERNVTRTAARLHITQPAASNALRRLRDALQDPILLPGKRGVMELTPRALDLVGPVEEALKAVGQVLNADTRFQPEVASDTIHLAVSEYVAFVLLPPLVRDLRRRAPGIHLAIHDIDKDDPLGPLRVGKIDIIAAFVPDPPKDLMSEALFTDRWVCIARKDAPSKRTLSLEDFATAHHISSPMQTGGTASHVQTSLSEHRIHRDIVVSTPHYLAVPQVVSSTDLIMTIPERLARALTKQMPLRIYPHPIKIPEFSVSMLWHPRTNMTATQTWIRDALTRAAKLVCGRESPLTTATPP
jgi:DNA-binding transcriptional LysR family regulator